MKLFKIFIILFLLGSLAGFSQEKKFTTYKVRSGETLESLSKTLKISKEEILKLNPDILKEVKQDQVLVIPNLDYDKTKDVSNFDTQMVSSNDIVIDGFVYHDVLPKETLFGISSKFKVPTATIKNNNPFLMFDGLQVGQTLKIPLPPNENKINTEDYLPYAVKPKDTKYSIAKTNQISIERLEEINPNIRDGLKIDDIIFLPKEVKRTADHGFKVHEVAKGETLFSLGQLYNVSTDELVNTNPQLSAGVKEGMLIRIPSPKRLSKEAFLDPKPLDRNMKMALMLPFQGKLDTLDFENDRLLNVATDFYLGALIALDSLKKQGFNLTVDVFDTQKSAWVSKNLLEKNNFSQYDLIIGPVYFNIVEELAPLLSGNHAYIVSPLSEKDHSQISNTNLVQASPTLDQLEFEMIDYLKTHHTDQKVILVSDEKSKDKLDLVMKELEGKIPRAKMVVIQPEKGYIKASKLKESLTRETEDWVVLLTKDEVTISDAVHNLGVLPEDYEVTMFALEKGKGFEKIDNLNLSRVNFHYPTFQFENYNDFQTLNFIKNYQQKYFGSPSAYAFKGFDITYDMVNRSTSMDRLSEQGYSERIWSKFNYVENTAGSVINQGVFIIRYNGLSLEKAQ